MFRNIKVSYRRIAHRISLLIVILMPFFAASCHTSRHAGSTSKNQKEISHIKIGAGDKLHRKIAEEAYSWLGTPYAYARADKGKGTDCSGMVMKVYETTTGAKLPRNSAKQADYCLSLESDELEVGDLVFFATGKDPEKVSHVGIMLNEEDFIHASTSKGVVISKITTPYYIRTFRKFGRVP